MTVSGNNGGDAARGDTKRVFYVKQVVDPLYLDTIASRPDIRIDKLENDASAAEFDAMIKVAHAYQIMSLRDLLNPRFQVNERVAAEAPNLLVVSTNGSGYDTVDVAACTTSGILVVNQAGGNREAVAEHAVAMMLSLAKRLGESDRQIRRLPARERPKLWGIELLGRHLGIVGLGRIGSRIAEICRTAFSMEVLAVDPHLAAGEMEKRGVRKVSFEELLRKSDFVSINCPRIPETLGMFSADAFSLMQRHAYLITTARGGIHDERALAAALREGRIAGAGLDVWEEEPPEPDHPLLQFSNVVASDHMAGSTRAARANLGRIGAKQLIGVLDGNRPRRIVNPEVWPAYAARFERIMGFAPRETLVEEDGLSS